MTADAPLGAAPATSDVTDRALLECHDVHKEFSGVRALAGVDMAVHPGEIVALVGPNGSGKSTLINVLTGFFPPTSGRVRFKGEDITGKPPHVISRYGLGRTYQIPRPFGSMTVLENVAYACMYRADAIRYREAADAAWEHLRFTGLDRVADLLPASITLQQRKFLELARALAAQPTVLMLDEVLTGLNPTEIDESAEMIARIHDSGVALVIVEHLMRVVTRLSTRMVVLSRGQVLAEGPPGAVMEHPDVVAAYLGQGHA